uniref:Protein odr-4 homolog n=1 Tax=Latimeria chalumnae TaxID=7897 RepID=H3B7Q8_LATCH
MGRSYIVDETVEKYLSKLSNEVQPFVTGLFIGQSSLSKDYVVWAVKTPSKEEQVEDDGKKRQLLQLGGIDEEWVTEHARQAARMLPGGLMVLGVFLVTPLELSKEAQNTLRKLVFAVEKAIMKRSLWCLTENDVSDRVVVHICSVTRKVLCRTYDILDPKSSPRPADWKYQNNVSTSWPLLECTIDIDLTVPLSAVSANHELEANTKNGLKDWTKQIQQSVCLTNGQVKEEDKELLEGQKKSAKGFVQPNVQTFTVQLLTPLCRRSEERSTARVLACNGSITLKGGVHCRAYIHTNKPKVREAVQSLKKHVLISLKLFKRVFHLVKNIFKKKKSLKEEHHTLPQRVFVSLHGSHVTVCDYLFGDEAAADLQERFREMFDCDLPEEQIIMTKEARADFANTDLNRRSEELKEIGKESRKIAKLTIVPKNMGVVFAAAVAFLAVAFSLFYFSD